MWQAVVHEIHNGTLLVCVQLGEDWERAEQVASFTELQQEEQPDGVERALSEAKDEAARRNADVLRAEFERLIPGVERR